MGTGRRVRVSSKGQLVIPKEMRETLGVEAGDELVLHLVSDRMLVAEVPEPTPFEEAVARLRAEAAERGITRDDVQRVVAEVRKETYEELRASHGDR